MASTLFLVDKSALEQRRRSDEARRLLVRLLAAGAVATCHVVAMEVLFSARNRRDYEALHSEIGALRWLATDDPAMDRALEVQRVLAQRGQHRLPIPDLMLAATAERHGATVLHFDEDFDLISAVTGQPTRWIVPRPSGA
ncbi:MAG TPA: PIN domain nuclease [Acidimicrobiales bacterium]|nr:PIN domain nuclease [Acidimicrobiales bacterium]